MAEEKMFYLKLIINNCFRFLRFDNLKLKKHNFTMMRMFLIWTKVALERPLIFYSAFLQATKFCFTLVIFNKFHYKICIYSSKLNSKCTLYSKNYQK